MKSFKQWQLVNESFFSGMTLGVKTPQTLGGLQSNRPLISEKKKMDGKVVVDDDDLGDDHEEDDHQEPDGDEGDCSCKGKGKEKDIAYSKKNMKKKMKKKMSDEMSGEDGDEDDVNDVKAPKSSGDEGGDEEGGDDEGGDDEGGDDHDDEGGEGDKDHEDDHDDDDAENGAKYGFMKDKKDKKKAKKEKKKVEENFWNDIKSYHVPKESGDDEQEFFDSLARQYGQPANEKYSGGVEGDGINEDLLLSDDQMALINAMPNPGEVGYAPNQRMGIGFTPAEQPELEELDITYGESVEISADFDVLCKYFSENVAREIIEKKRNR